MIELIQKYPSNTYELTQTFTATGYSDAIEINPDSIYLSVSLKAVGTSVIQYTLDSDIENADWINWSIGNITNDTVADSTTGPVSAIRVNLVSGTSAKVSIRSVGVV